MKPTPILRWVRGVHAPINKAQIFDALGNKLVLQQWWHESGEPPPSSYGEWRDIEVVKE